MYEKLITIVDAIDTGESVSITQYNTVKLDIEKKIEDAD